MSEEEREAIRREAHFRRLGSRNPSCSVRGCSERRLEALTGVDPHIVCYEHSAVRQGRPPCEAQHPEGKGNDPEATILIGGNDHRVWDDAKRDWPDRTLRNPDGSPLLKLAAILRALLDFVKRILEPLMRKTIALLEGSDEVLRVLLGAGWWGQLGWNDE
jgi:hypothetical protein